MTKYRKKPVVIEAEQYKPGMEDGFEERYTHHLNPNRLYGIKTSKEDVAIQVPYIETLEGRQPITKGDWIITGVKGERYLMKQHILKSDYIK